MNRTISYVNITRIPPLYTPRTDWMMAMCVVRGDRRGNTDDFRAIGTRKTMRNNID